MVREKEYRSEAIVEKKIKESPRLLSELSLSLVLRPTCEWVKRSSLLLFTIHQHKSHTGECA